LSSASAALTASTTASASSASSATTAGSLHAFGPDVTLLLGKLLHCALVPGKLSSVLGHLCRVFS
jgi:hypothetical protein